MSLLTEIVYKSLPPFWNLLTKKSTENTVFHGGSEPYLSVVNYWERHLTKKVFYIFLVHQGKYWSNWVVLSFSRICSSSKEAPKTVVARLIWNIFPFQKACGLVGQWLLKLPLAVAVVQEFTSNRESDKSEICIINQSLFVIR